MPSLNILNLLYSLTQLDIFLHGYTFYSLIFTLESQFKNYSMYKVNLMNQLTFLSANIFISAFLHHHLELHKISSNN